MHVKTSLASAYPTLGCSLCCNFFCLFESSQLTLNPLQLIRTEPLSHHAAHMLSLWRSCDLYGFSRISQKCPESSFQVHSTTAAILEQNYEIKKLNQGKEEKEAKR